MRIENSNIRMHNFMHSYRIKLSAGFRNLGYPSGNPLIKSFASFVIC